ncbi:DNA repair protein SWI5 homolog [Nycticebus coucang]|uniref:DNA repair protein SWI5 homolog n=1 Tax=Nycticebus coucang TaxID=9470 RepID=UPI00234D575B|nr:DNA repair protein SWI5 homolog [Nycticebus coucang]
MEPRDPEVKSPRQLRTCAAALPDGPDSTLCGPALDPLAPLNPPLRGPRTPGLRRFLSRAEPGLSRSYRGTFRSPRPPPKPGQADGTGEESLLLDIQKLKEKEDMLDKEIYQLISEGYSVDELEDHIAQLHEYNDIKDVGQMLLGKLAIIRGVTTKELYPEFGLDMND